jgi:hypothetical protein
MKANRVMTSIGVATLLAAALVLPGTASADDGWHGHGRGYYGNAYYGPPGHVKHFWRHSGVVVVNPVLVQPYAVYAAPPPVVVQPYPYVAYPGNNLTITFGTRW